MSTVTGNQGYLKYFTMETQPETHSGEDTGARGSFPCHISGIPGRKMTSVAANSEVWGGEGMGGGLF